MSDKGASEQLETAKHWITFLGTGLLVIQAVLLFISLFATNFLPWACGDTIELPPVMQRVRDCPEARKALGANIKLPVFGCTTCSYKSSGDSGNVSARLTIRGDRARGGLRYKSMKREGRWRLVYATLSVDGKEIDLMACKPARKRSAAAGRAAHDRR